MKVLCVQLLAVLCLSLSVIAKEVCDKESRISRTRYSSSIGSIPLPSWIPQNKKRELPRRLLDRRVKRTNRHYRPFNKRSDDFRDPSPTKRNKGRKGKRAKGRHYRPFWRRRKKSRDPVTGRKKTGRKGKTRNGRKRNRARNKRSKKNTQPRVGDGGSDNEVIIHSKPTQETFSPTNAPSSAEADDSYSPYPSTMAQTGYPTSSATEFTSSVPSQSSTIGPTVALPTLKPQSSVPTIASDFSTTLEPTSHDGVPVEVTSFQCFQLNAQATVDVEIAFRYVLLVDFNNKAAVQFAVRTTEKQILDGLLNDGICSRRRTSMMRSPHRIESSIISVSSLPFDEAKESCGIDCSVVQGYLTVKSISGIDRVKLKCDILHNVRKAVDRLGGANFVNTDELCQEARTRSPSLVPSLSALSLAPSFSPPLLAPSISPSLAPATPRDPAEWNVEELGEDEEVTELPKDPSYDEASQSSARFENKRTSPIGFAVGFSFCFVGLALSLLVYARRKKWLSPDAEGDEEVHNESTTIKMSPTEETELNSCLSSIGTDCQSRIGADETKSTIVFVPVFDHENDISSSKDTYSINLSSNMGPNMHDSYERKTSDLMYSQGSRLDTSTQEHVKPTSAPPSTRATPKHLSTPSESLAMDSAKSVVEGKPDHSSSESEKLPCESSRTAFSQEAAFDTEELLVTDRMSIDAESTVLLAKADNPVSEVYSKSLFSTSYTELEKGTPQVGNEALTEV